MSIDSKIAEIMEESKLAGLVLENEEELDEEFITEEEYDSLDEEEQALFELSKATLGSYIKKANADYGKNTRSASREQARGEGDKANKSSNKAFARQAGISKAVNKLTKEEYDSLDEEEQTLFELSKKTLGSYVKKAATSGIVNGEKLGAGAKWSDSGRIALKRDKGITKAVDKMTKEELTLEDYSVEELEDFMMSEDFEQLDELSKKTLGSYVKKASKQYNNSINKTQTARTTASQEKHAGIVAKRHKGIGSVIKRQTADDLNTQGVHNHFIPKAINSPEKIAKNTLSSRSVADIAKVRKNVKESIEDFDVQEDVDALLFGEDLTEEFKVKAATIFEAAVVVRVKEEVSRLEEEFEEQLAEQVDSITEGLVEKIDGYLDYVVEQWIEQNEIALENGLKSDIMESFITGMKGLFEEHYIDVPEEKYDVIGEMETKIDVLESKLNEQVERNIDLKKSLSESVRKEIVNMVSEGLTDTEVEKFTALVEELSYDSEDLFKVKVQTIRENYFTGKHSALVESFVTDSPVDEINENKYVNVDPTVAAYAKVLQKYNQ